MTDTDNIADTFIERWLNEHPPIDTMPIEQFYDDEIETIMRENTNATNEMVVRLETQNELLKIRLNSLEEQVKQLAEENKDLYCENQALKKNGLVLI